MTGPFWKICKRIGPQYPWIFIMQDNDYNTWTPIGRQYPELDPLVPW